MTWKVYLVCDWCGEAVGRIESSLNSKAVSRPGGWQAIGDEELCSTCADHRLECLESARKDREGAGTSLLLAKKGKS